MRAVQSVTSEGRHRSMVLPFAIAQQDDSVTVRIGYILADDERHRAQ
jgi:hypothetical protein